MTIDAVPGVTFTVVGLLVAAVPYYGSKYAEGISDTQGHGAPDVPRVLERRRSEVLDRLARKAEHIGADAVVGVRMDTREITGTWKELCAYGTAIRVHSM